MFEAFGRAVVRTPVAIVFAWVVALLAVELLAPRWEDMARGGEFTFLPSRCPCRQGEDLFGRAFPDELLSSNVVILLHRDENPAQLSAADRNFVSDVLAPRLEAIAQAGTGSTISRIRTCEDRGVGPLLESADQQAALVVLELATDFFDNRNFPTVEQIEELIADLQQESLVPAGLKIGVTGSATLGRDMAAAEKTSANSARFWTIVLVIAFLLILYRAPLLALVPLLTLFVSVQIALRLLAALAQARVVGIFPSLEAYITVVAYGAGVDYTLFLIARYKERLEQGDSPRDAVANAIGGVGAAVTASAGTVICGIGMLGFAEFGKFREAGIGLSFSLFVVFCAVLTFTPALLCLAGRWAVWPKPDGAIPLDGAVANTQHWIHLNPCPDLWEMIGRALERWPGIIWLASVGALLPFLLVGVCTFSNVSYSLLDQLPRAAPSAAGARILNEHFPAGIAGPITVLLTNPEVDFSGGTGQQAIQELVERLNGHRQELDLADIRSVATPLGVASAAEKTFSGRTSAQAFLIRGALRRKATEHYVCTAADLNHHVTRLDLVLNSDPFSRASLERLSEIEKTLPAELPEALRAETCINVIGPTASIRDLKSVADRDRIIVNSLVVSVVFGILVILLRQIVVSLYLIVSVLFSYLATLGVAYVVFWIWDPSTFDGLDWNVSMVLFAILVAVGEDYNIFLMTRVHEEQDRLGPLSGIREALTRTGGTITSCGFIMAGTFTSLMTGSHVRLIQLGFALAFGVLLDTFVVRPLLVPAFLMVMENGTFGAWGKFLVSRGVRRGT